MSAAAVGVRVGRVGLRTVAVVAIFKGAAAVAGWRVFGQSVAGRTVARVVGDDRHVAELWEGEIRWASMLLPGKKERSG